MAAWRIVLALAVATLPASAMSKDDLGAALVNRLQGDRSGATIAAALVGPDATATAFVGADPAHPRMVDAHSTFEIGNLSKTMLSALVMRSVQKGDLALTDPLARLLPKDTKVPDYQGQPITIGDLLQHLAGLPGLPARLQVEDDADPFRTLTTDQLLASLGEVRLAAAPGTGYRASTFAMMLLSHALAQHQGLDFQTLIDRELFKPLAMADAHLVRQDPPLTEVQGHASNGLPAKAWNLPPELAGGGGVRASLTDLVNYAQAALGQRPGEIARALAATLAAPPDDWPSPARFSWKLIRRSGRILYTCEGATGGFSSFLAFDPQRRQAVVLLADTALANLGGLEPLGLSLLDPSFPSPGLPRRPVPPGDLLLERLEGTYHVEGRPDMTLTRNTGRLFAQFGDLPPHEMGFDTAGDFYALDQDFLVHPIRTPNGYTFSLRQGGGHLDAVHLNPTAPKDALLDAQALKALEGDYLVKSGFTVTVTARGDKLYVQGTSQPEFLVTQVRKDTFATFSGSAEFTFLRDAKGKVKGLSVRQNGKTMSGDRH